MDIRLKALLVIPLAAIALGGCLKEHPGECDVPNNLELIFTYDDAPGEAFTERTTSVDVILFDMQGYFYTHRRVSLAELTTFAGARFSVPSGIYYAVAWGNVRDNSYLTSFAPGVSTFGDCYLEIDPSSTETGDPVYYAPHKEKPAARSRAVATRDAEMVLYVVDVPIGQKSTTTLDFVRAHRTLNVWIKGYQEVMTGQSDYPVITATERWSKYDFHFTTQSLRRDYTQQSYVKTVDDVEYASATFHAALGKIDSNIDVILTRADDNGHVVTVNLKQFVADNNITDTDEIDILISFLPDLGITVTIPQWTGTPVKPGV